MGFFNDGGRRLNKVSVEDGIVVSLHVPSGYGASWGADGSIIIGGGFTNGLLRVPENGGTPTTVLDLGPGDILYRTPQILPGGKAVLFVSYGQPSGTAGNIEVFSYADRRRKTLVRGTDFARYLASGHLVYTHERTLFAIPFDVNRLETRGTAVPVLTDLDPGNDLDFSGNGTLVYRKSGGGDKARLGIIQWVDRAGKRETILAKPDVCRNPYVSPDAKRLAFVLPQPTSQDVWVYDTERDATTRIERLAVAGTMCPFGLRTGITSFSPQWVRVSFGPIPTGPPAAAVDPEHPRPLRLLIHVRREAAGLRRYVR